MPDRSRTCTNSRQLRCLRNLFGFKDFQKFPTCSAVWTPATWTASRRATLRRRGAPSMNFASNGPRVRMPSTSGVNSLPNCGQ